MASVEITTAQDMPILPWRDPGNPAAKAYMLEEGNVCVNIPLLSEVEALAVSFVENDESQKFVITTHNGDGVAKLANSMLHEEKYYPYLKRLGDIYAKIFQSEWLENNASAETFIREIAKLGENDVFTVVWDESNLPVGVGVARVLDRECLFSEMSAFLDTVIQYDPTVFKERVFDQLPEKSVYWSELFIDPGSRSGLEPFRTLTRNLLSEVVKLPDVQDGTELLLMTKGHRPLKEDEIKVLENDPLLSKAAKNDEDLKEIRRKISRRDIAGLNELGIHPGLYVSHLSNRVLPVMGFAQALGMKQYSNPEIEAQDRYIFSININDLLDFSKSPNRLMLYLRALKMRYFS